MRFGNYRKRKWWRGLILQPNGCEVEIYFGSSFVVGLIVVCETVIETLGETSCILNELKIEGYKTK